MKLSIRRWPGHNCLARRRPYLPCASIRPPQRIIAFTTGEPTRRRLSARWCVEPFLLEVTAPAIDPEWLSEQARAALSDSDAALGELNALLIDLLASADRALIEYNLAPPGEKVVVMAGKVRDVTLSHSIKIHTVGELSGTS